MLTWNVTYHCKPGQRDAFFKAVSQLGMRENSNGEAGNLKYDYYFSAQDSNELLLVESWTEPELQSIHCQSDLFAQLQAAKEEYVETVSIDKFHF